MANPVLSQQQLRALRALATRTFERSDRHWSDGRNWYALQTVSILHQKGFANVSPQRDSVRITTKGRGVLAVIDGSKPIPLEHQAADALVRWRERWEAENVNAPDADSGFEDLIELWTVAGELMKARGLTPSMPS